MFLSSLDLFKVSAVLCSGHKYQNTQSHLLGQACSCLENSYAGSYCRVRSETAAGNAFQKVYVVSPFVWNSSMSCKPFYSVWCDVTANLKLLFKMEKKSCKYLIGAKLTNDSFVPR